MILSGIFFTIAVPLSAMNNMETFEVTEKIVKCYDRSYNEIVGLECKEYEFGGQGIIFMSAFIIVFLFTMGSWLYFSKGRENE